MFEPRVIERETGDYPVALERCLAASAPEEVLALGPLELLERPKLALFCSQHCPGALASAMYDLAQHVRDAGVTAIGGFHSPLEKAALELLLRSPHPVVVCLGRSLYDARLPAIYHRPLAEERLLLLSPFPRSINRVTQDTARQRNLFAAALSEQVVVAHAAPGSGTLRFCEKVLKWGKPVWALDSPRNEALFAAGAHPIEPARVAELF